MDLLELQREAALLPPDTRQKLVYFLVSLQATEDETGHGIRKKIADGLEDICRDCVLDEEQTKEAMREGKRLWRAGQAS